MGLPGFHAAAPAHRIDDNKGSDPGVAARTFASVAVGIAHRGSVVPQLCPPPGLCAKAFRLCMDPRGRDTWIESLPPRGNWCSIAARCSACYFEE